ncbi:MAG TPA: transcription termination/antitermination NusG family protein [Candidatus Limnocylindrales bacterium]|jgi:transcriptional antiterminator RfaH|nr:transcription termination/antitermination NusG family protein [Candidatus Limnocylindrales bacterium]
MISSVFDAFTADDRAWFCIRSHPRRECVAAAYLREDLGLEVYLPRIRFKRHTRKGPKWFIEALFPNYLFARFNLVDCFRQVHHGFGARGIVHFGNHWPTIPDALIETMRESIQHNVPYVLSEDFRPGDKVVISGGPLHQFEAIVKRVMPGARRAAVLLDFLGSQRMIELGAETLVKRGEE